MPNEVYYRTRDALATLVSERAATRVLDAALRRSHESSEALDERTVRHLLLGPVQRELEGILPRTGLRRTLRRLARQVADEVRTQADVPPDVPNAFAREAPHDRRGGERQPPDAEAHTPAALQPVTQSSVYLPDVSPSDAEAPARGRPFGDVPPPPPAPHGATASATRSGAAVATAATVPERRRDTPRPTVVPHPLDAEALDALSVRFAEIEAVRQVIALRAADEPQVRGDGIDADALAPLAQSAVRLLGRFGPLRSLVLEHELGLLFIFPLGRDAIAVLARANVNMGAVFAARAALEEGP
ncbi:MAG: hypothetical protein P8Y02_15835 [Deinococcales bacterium]